METKSTNEVKGDYDRVSASECLGSLIELHGIVMEDDLFVIPDADGTAVLYNDGKIRFDEIADIEVGSVFVGILLRNGYLFYLSRTEPLKTCIYTHLLAATTLCWNFVLGFITKIGWALVCYLRFSWVWTWLSPTWRRLRSRPSVWRSAVPRLFPPRSVQRCD